MPTQGNLHWRLESGFESYYQNYYDHANKAWYPLGLLGEQSLLLVTYRHEAVNAIILVMSLSIDGIDEL